MNQNGIVEDIKIILKYNKSIYIFYYYGKERLVEKVKNWIDLENEISYCRKK